MTAFTTVYKANDKRITCKIQLDPAFVTVRVTTTYIKSKKLKISPPLTGKDFIFQTISFSSGTYFTTPTEV